MSKFSKRILSSSKYCRNSLVVGTGFGWLEQLIEHCNTVFIIDNFDKNIKGRNVIHREDFQEIQVLTDIDFIFVDSSHFSNLNKLRPVWTKCRPAIFLEGSDFFGKENYKYLRSESYLLVEIFKNMQKWIPQ
jgi:hypothetical protein